jgi:hypothetical protein
MLGAERVLAPFNDANAEPGAWNRVGGAYGDVRSDSRFFSIPQHAGAS